MDYGWLSILPPIIAIALALTTKEVLSSLLVGILSGALIYSHGNVIAMIETTFGLMTEKTGENAGMIIFLALLGCLVVVVTKAGGSFAYGEWAKTKIKSKSGVQLATSFLGLLIFIDDYFNCLTVGTVMRPLSDNYKVSRAKLAYIIDSTAAPVCIISPISSWAAAVAATIGSISAPNGEPYVTNSIGMFISTIPFNLYAIFTIFTVLYFSFSKHEIGAMRKFEDNDTSINVEQEKTLDVEISPNGHVCDLIIPVFSLILFSILFMVKTGGYFSGEGVTLAEAFGDADTEASLVLGSVLSLFVAFVMFVPRKLIGFKDFMESMYDGIKSMVPAIAILILAWTIGGICRSGYLDTGGFLAHVILDNNIPIFIFPVVLFLIASGISFSTGTAWGTFGILVPITLPIIFDLGASHQLPIILGAIFSGAVFGDHCSPISDTTILSSAGAGCNHIDHVTTQIPYALTVATACIVGFIVGGLTNNVFLTLAVTLVLLLLLLFAEKRITEKRFGTRNSQ